MIENLIDEIPVIRKEYINLEPGQTFRLEGVLFKIKGLNITGNALFLFTGLVSHVKSLGRDFIHCVPVFFYSDNALRLTSEYKGKGIWVEITDLQELHHENGYIN